MLANLNFDWLTHRTKCFSSHRADFLDSDLKNKKMRRPLQNKLTALAELTQLIASEPDAAIATQMILDALDKIENDLMAKTDGFYGEKPKNDWIITEEGQDLLFPVLALLADSLSGEL